MPKPPLVRSNGDDRRQRRKQGGAVGAAASRMRATAKQTLGAATRAVARRRRDGEVLSWASPFSGNIRRPERRPDIIWFQTPQEGTGSPAPFRWSSCAAGRRMLTYSGRHHPRPCSRRRNTGRPVRRCRRRAAGQQRRPEAPAAGTASRSSYRRPASAPRWRP